MRRTRMALAAALVLAACAIPPAPPRVQLPPDTYGIGVDNDVGAIDFAQWAFADPARTRGNPVNGARAAAAVEYLAVELSADPRWVGMSPITKLQMQQASAELRQTLGIEPDAPTQLVLNGLIGAAGALQAGNNAAALAVLVPPVFTLGPEATLARLTDLPFQRQANIATQHAALQRTPSGCLGCQ